MGCGMLTGCVVAYVGVRSGSTRVPSKNSRPFTYDRASGEALSLLDLKLRTLARVPSVDAVIVSSDSEEMLAVAARYAHVTPLRRDPYYASSTVPVAEFFRHMAREVRAFNATTVLWAPVTAPMLGADDYERLVATHRGASTDEYDSVGIVLEHLGHFWFEGAARPRPSLACDRLRPRAASQAVR